MGKKQYSKIYKEKQFSLPVQSLSLEAATASGVSFQKQSVNFKPKCVIFALFF